MNVAVSQIAVNVDRLIESIGWVAIGVVYRLAWIAIHFPRQSIRLFIVVSEIADVAVVDIHARLERSDSVGCERGAHLDKRPAVGGHLGIRPAGAIVGCLVP